MKAFLNLRITNSTKYYQSFLISSRKPFNASSSLQLIRPFSSEGQGDSGEKKTDTQPTSNFQKSKGAAKKYFDSRASRESVSAQLDSVLERLASKQIANNQAFKSDSVKSKTPETVKISNPSANKTEKSKADTVGSQVEKPVVPGNERKAPAKAPVGSAKPAVPSSAAPAQSTDGKNEQHNKQQKENLKSKNPQQAKEAPQQIPLVSNIETKDDDPEDKETESEWEKYLEEAQKLDEAMLQREADSYDTIGIFNNVVVGNRFVNDFATFMDDKKALRLREKSIELESDSDSEGENGGDSSDSDSDGSDLEAGDEEDGEEDVEDDEDNEDEKVEFADIVDQVVELKSRMMKTQQDRLIFEKVNAGKLQLIDSSRFSWIQEGEEVYQEIDGERRIRVIRNGKEIGSYQENNGFAGNYVIFFQGGELDRLISPSGKLLIEAFSMGVKYYTPHGIVYRDGLGGNQIGKNINGFHIIHDSAGKEVMKFYPNGKIHSYLMGPVKAIIDEEGKLRCVNNLGREVGRYDAETGYYLIRDRFMKPLFGFKNNKLRFEKVKQDYYYYNTRGEKAFVTALMDQELVGRFSVQDHFYQVDEFDLLEDDDEFIDVDFYTPLILESEDRLLEDSEFEEHFKDEINNSMNGSPSTPARDNFQAYLNQVFGAIPSEKDDHISDHFYRPPRALESLYEASKALERRETLVDRMQFEDLTAWSGSGLTLEEHRDDIKTAILQTQERIDFMDSFERGVTGEQMDSDPVDEIEDLDADDDHEDIEVQELSGRKSYHPRDIRRDQIMKATDLSDAAANLMKYIDSIDNSESNRRDNLRKAFPKGFNKANQALLSEMDEKEFAKHQEQEESEIFPERRNRYQPAPNFSLFDRESSKDGGNENKSHDDQKKKVSSRQGNANIEIIDFDEELKKINSSKPKKDFIELDDIDDYPSQNWDDDYETRQLTASERIALFDHAWWLEKIRNERLEIEADPNQPKDFLDELLDDAWLNAPKTSDLSYEVLFENPAKKRLRIPKPRHTEQLLNAIEPRVYSKDRSSTSYKRAVQSWNVLLKNKYYPWQEKEKMAEHVAREWEEYQTYLKEKKAKNQKADRIFLRKFRPGPRLYEAEMEEAQGLLMKMNADDLERFDREDADATAGPLVADLGLSESGTAAAATVEVVEAVEDEDSLFAEDSHDKK